MLITSLLGLVILTLHHQVQAMDDSSTDSTSDAVVILSVSVQLGTENTVPIGSTMGGTTLYMKVSGLDQTASNNAVYIGNYPCIISDKGVNGLFMNCKTTKADDDDTNLSNLAIVVQVTGKPDSVCTFSSVYCKFTYSNSYTPKLYYVTPRSNYPRALSAWRAKWIVTSSLVEYLEGQYMVGTNNNRCDRFTIQDNYEDDISASDDIVVCQISGEAIAGYYTYLINSQRGYQINDVGVKQKMVYSDETYQSKILPLITSIASNYVSPQGQVLQINGYGFSPIIANNKVSISGSTTQLTVLSATVKTIIVQIPPISDLPKLEDLTDNTIYIQGSGLFYTRYDISTLGLSVSTFRTQIINNPSQMEQFIQFDGIIGEPDVQNFQGTYYGEYYRGFFKAPITGKYRFYLASDDASLFYIQTTSTLSTTRPTTATALNYLNPYKTYWQEPLLYSTSTTYTIKSVSDYIQLMADQYYYIELYHINSASTGYATLSVEIENTSGERKYNSINSLYSIQTSYTPILEVIQFSLYNSNGNSLLSGTYNLKFTYGTKSSPQVGVYYSYTTIALTSSSTALAIENAIQNCGGSYSVTVLATKLDNQGNELDSSVTEFAGYKYTITFDVFRGTSNYRALPKIVSSTLAGGTVVSNIQLIQDPSDPISGTFQISMDIDGQENLFQVTTSNYDIPFDTTATLIADNVQRITGVRPLVWTQGVARDGWFWRIQLRSYVSGFTGFSSPSSLLVSGNGDVTITFDETIQSSDNLLFEPIPNELLFTYSDKPQIQVITNEILAGCEYAEICDFTLSDTRTPTLLTYSTNNAQLSTSLQAGVDLPKILQSDLTITYLGAECSNVQIVNEEESPYSITCQLEQINSENIQEAGLGQVPLIHHQLIGYALIDSQVISTDIQLEITSITPQSGSPAGGTLVTLIGKGFPKNSDKDFLLTIDGKTVSPSSINNQEIIFTTPEGTSGNIVLTYNQLTASTTFNYDDSKRIYISSLEFNSVSPLYKGLFTITGTNFGSDVESLIVSLVSASKSYNAKVVSASDTSITVYLRGGMPGNYQVIVTRSGYGNSEANGNDNQLSYIIPITSVTLEDGSKATGSEAGGTVIKITGSNFVQGQTLVFVGNAVNWLCTIDESRFSSEVIYCTVPARNEIYEIDAQDVIVTLSVTLESTCIATDKSNCQFTYDNTLNPTIDNYPENAVAYSSNRILTEKQNYKPDYQRLINKKRFLWTKESMQKGHNHILNLGKSKRRDLLTSADLAINVVKTYQQGDTEILTGTNLSNTVKVYFSGIITQLIEATLEGNTITYTIPSLPQGLYITYILTETGYATKIWYTQINLQITSVSTAVVGGSILTINGGGFNSDYSPSITIGSYSCSEITVNTYQQINCRMPKVTGNSLKLTLSQMPSDSSTAAAYTATYTLPIVQSSNTPYFSQMTINGQNTYDQSKLAYLATTGNIILTISGVRMSGSNVQISLEVGIYKIIGDISSSQDTSIIGNFNNLPVGSYTLNILIDSKYLYFADVTKQTIIVSGTQPTSNQPSVSYAGGATVSFTGSGFDSTQKQNVVTICGFNCPITSSSYSTLTCQAPSLLTQSVWNQFISLQAEASYIQPSQVIVSADSSQTATKFFDLYETTYYSSTATSNCYAQISFNDGQIFTLHQLRYMPQITVAAIYLKDAEFQYTIDGSNWQTLLLIDQTVHTGWNIYVPDNDIVGIKAIRLFDSRGISGSSCKLAEIQLKGWIFADTTNLHTQDTQCNTLITVNGQKFETISNSAIYSINNTPIVNNVSPKVGRFTEQAIITISGTGFVEDQTTVYIDGVECIINSVSSTEIICKTGIKDLDQTQLDGLFEVKVNGNLAVNNAKFIYATKWSDINTWGGYEYPAEGDSIIVQMGQTLIVDVNTPKVNALLVEGTLTFSDDLDTSIDAHYIMIVGGKFHIGSALEAHQHKVQITLYGVQEDTQMPAMGNKVLGCHQCELIIHGIERTPTWTLLSSTADIGDTQITVDDEVDWQIGEQIVITSSEGEHAQSEKRYIIDVSQDKKTLTLDEPLIYRHYSNIEIYDNQQFPMKVEVGLLTRNIVIQGEQSDLKYGYHLMIHGRSEKGSVGKISYAEFRYGGQPMIIGRYPIHFHLNGDVDNSYVVGNSIHDCYARCTTIHGVHYLKYQKNVCYNTFGHAVFLEDGIETNNIIEDNLVAGTRQSWIMLQTDITVATYWITNPQNIVRRNRSGGSEWYGFWYEIKTNPDGPSATSDICPPGLNVIEFNDNWSHSNGRFGLRVFVLAPRLYPCQDPTIWRNNSQPYTDNPSLQAVFQNFYTWKNKECGILGEELGNVLFANVMIAESSFAGFQGHKANYSAEGVQLINATIIYKSNNPSPDDFYTSTRGIIVPRTNGFIAKNIRFYNFDENSILLQSCSVCWSFKVWVTGGKNSQFENITMINSEGAQKIFWENWRREIFWDIDGSFTNTQGGAYIIPYKKHIDGIDGCNTQLNSHWNDSIICQMNSVTIRDVLINNPVPAQDFYGTNIKFFRLNETNVATKMDQTINESLYIQSEIMRLIKPKSRDVYYSYASVFATGYTYNVQFEIGGSDPTSFGLFASPYFTQNDQAIIFRFNYSLYRESFDIYRNLGGIFQTTYTNISTIPDVNTCNQGDHYLDGINKLFYICLSGKNKTKYEYVEVQAVICRETCSTLGDTDLENDYRYWSNSSTWDNGIVPVEGDSPTINASYQVILDVDPPKLVNLTILGRLIFDETRDQTTLQAERIWARSGKIIAGNSTNPFPGKINIIINGEFGDDSLVIDENLDVGSKVMAITNGIELYSTPPNTTWTRLSTYTYAGATQVTVLECNDWVIGDQIVFGPSGSNPEQNEKKTIAAINDGCIITLDSELIYDHYGAPDVTLTKNGIGVLDMRAVVGHLTRKIKIQGGYDINGLGCRVLIYQFQEEDLSYPRRGYAIMHGVEFENCGQYDSQRSGLDFRNLNSNLITTASEVIGCSFHDTTGISMTIMQSQYITVKNNVFYNGMKSLVQLINSQYIVFQNNAFIYVRQRVREESGLPNWAVFLYFVYKDEVVATSMTRDIVDVSGNVGQGSQYAGYFAMASKCSDSDKASFYNNTCSSSIQSCFGIRQADSNCAYISQLFAFHSEIGIMFSVNCLSLTADRVIVAENKVGIVLKLGGATIQDNFMKFTNSYVTPYIRDDCPQCYSQTLGAFCSSTYGARMGSITSLSFPPIADKDSDEFDSHCTIQRVDLRVYINNVEFNNYKTNYANAPRCGKNAVFRQNHAATDMSGQHYLINSPCNNCDFAQLLYKLQDADWTKVGWINGCGSFECTGQKNILIEDQTGHFFGKIGQGLSNNTYFAPNVTDCYRQDSWNGYFCPGRTVSTLHFMSTASDYNKRLYSPVKLTNGLFFNELNSYFEWEWDGPEPLNLRESKFVGLISVNTIINMTNAGMNPTDSDYWLTKRYEAGSPDDWVIIKLQFSTPQIIQIKVNGIVIQPGITVKLKHYDLTTMTSICGANNYFYDNRTIHFVVTGALGCKVSVSLKNTLQVSSRLVVTEEEFYGTKFLQYAAALLGGDPYNFFIVGTNKYRRILDQSSFNLQVDWAIADDAQIGTDEGAKSADRLAIISEKLGEFLTNSDLSEIGISKITIDKTSIQSISTLNYPSTEATSNSTQNNQTTSPDTNTNQTVSNNTNSNSNSSNNNTDVILDQGSDEGINESNDNNTNENDQQAGVVKQSLKSSNDYPTTVVIVVSVVCSIVGLSLIIIGYIYWRRLKLAKISAERAQKVDNEFVKVNYTDQGVSDIQIQQHIEN